MTHSSTEPAPAPRLRWQAWLLPGLVLLLLALGAGLRLFDLTDQPIDFHATRQLRNAIVARSIYLQLAGEAALPGLDGLARERLIQYGYSVGQYEPPIIESLVARSYLLMGAENLWVSRLWTGLFWLVGGLAVFDLGRRLASAANGLTEAAGGLTALAYYLILPFAVQASRSFQPDPGMVMWYILTVWALERWSAAQAGSRASWGWAIAAGLLGGMAVLTKIVAAFIVAAPAAALALHTLGLRRVWRSLQVYVMAALMILPPVIYYVGMNQGRAGDYFQGWTLALAHLLIEPSFYIRWFNLAQSLMGLGALLLALLGTLIAAPRARLILLSLWAGYALYGLFLPYQMYTHSYYHLQLTPIVALSLVPAAALLAKRIAAQPRLFRLLAGLVMTGGLAFVSWVSITELAREDYRSEPAYWQGIASYLPTDGKIIGLTQDYGYRMMYYGQRKISALWPNRGERTLASLRGSAKQFESYFARRIEGRDYFLVTSFGQFNSQADLKEMLEGHYPLLAEGQGYRIYDLRREK